MKVVKKKKLITAWKTNKVTIQKKNHSEESNLKENPLKEHVTINENQGRRESWTWGERI